MLPPSLLLMLW